jgi:hypothetical protein
MSKSLLLPIACRHNSDEHNLIVLFLIIFFIQENVIYRLYFFVFQAFGTNACLFESVRLYTMGGGQFHTRHIGNPYMAIKSNHISSSKQTSLLNFNSLGH